MPRLSSDFPTANPTANSVYEVDFAAQLPAGRTLDGVEWRLSLNRVQDGYRRDPQPMARLSGSPTLSGTETTQRIAGLYAGNEYLVLINGKDSAGDVIPLWNLLLCREAGRNQ